MLPCMRETCIGKLCGNFNDRESKFGNPNLKQGCKGGDYPPWSFAKWYINKFIGDSSHEQIQVM